MAHQNPIFFLFGSGKETIAAFKIETPIGHKFHCYWFVFGEVSIRSFRQRIKYLHQLLNCVCEDTALDICREVNFSNSLHHSLRMNEEHELTCFIFVPSIKELKSIYSLHYFLALQAYFMMFLGWPTRVNRFSWIKCNLSKKYNLII